MGQRFLETDIDAQIVRLEHFRELIHRIFHHPALHRYTSMQHVVLLASILKVTETAHSVQLLAGHGHVEDIQALSRTLVEVTVNAAYLQHSEEDELQKFIQFHAKLVYAQLAQLGSGRSNRVLDTIRGLLGARKPAQQREHGDPTWSGKTLAQRATDADETGEIPVMKLLIDRVYPSGHAAIHGTMEALEPFIARLDPHGVRPRLDRYGIHPQPARAEVRPQPDRHESKAEALFSVNLCLFTLCLYLNQSFNLRLDKALEDAAQARHPLSSLRSEQHYAPRFYPEPVRISA